ncbi:MAG TPA: PilZ domain-containing protein [Allosphingosinicella sp.]|nr:PilZ domain-containing protein [Allosphingosinicella sp.]
MSREVGQGPREPRTNLFIMATIQADSGSGPVRVRNLSPTGALIEGPVLPEAGTRARLSRGGLSVMGGIVWNNAGRAGVRFESTVSVAEWLPEGRAAMTQQRVDEIVQQVTTRKGDADPAALGAVPASRSTGPKASDLRQLKLAILSLAEDLAADPAFVERHGTKLQTLDMAAEALGKLAAERAP